MTKARDRIKILKPNELVPQSGLYSDKIVMSE